MSIVALTVETSDRGVIWRSAGRRCRWKAAALRPVLQGEVLIKKGRGPPRSQHSLSAKVADMWGLGTGLGLVGLEICGMSSENRDLRRVRGKDNGRAVKI